jgi:multiple antibiotic resistance protein
MMPLLEYMLLAMSSLFVIVDPLAVVPAFIAMTPDNTPAERIRMARVASFVMAGVLLAFAFAGHLIFRVLGITMPAFEISASIVLLLVSLDMLRAQRSRVLETREETAAGMVKMDIAVTPLAIPMLSGPGAISTVILLQNHAQNIGQRIGLILSIGVVSVATYVVLRISAHGIHWLSPIALNIAIRIMGLLLAAVALQFMINGILGVRADWLAVPATAVAP